jgi:transcriptional regulator with XRE-family HTH domain
MIADMGLSNSEFAEKVGITSSYASYLRNGGRLPSLLVFIRIIREFPTLNPVEMMRAVEKGPDEFARALRRNIFDSDDDLVGPAA